MKIMWIWSLFLSRHLIMLYSSFLWWCEMVKMPLWWDEVHEWCRPCDVVSIGYYWPSEGGPSASGDPGSVSHDDVSGGMSGEDDVKCWGSQVGWGRMVWDFITLLRMVCNLTTITSLFGSGDWFHGRKFFHGPGMGGSFTKWHLLCTSFLLLLLHQFYLR